MGKSDSGFTLMEVIVSVAVLAISFVMIMQLFSGGLRASRTSCDYSRAIVHAKDKMEEMSIFPENTSGEFGDGFRWETEVEPVIEPSEDNNYYSLLKIKVRILWDDVRGKTNHVELISLRTMKEDRGG
jgi:general secretion pathway protein I